ncbi:MAG: hypothetical protein Q8O31_05745 [Rhodocyclaceae bacterium]|nr:hypothetical protein [Rhodocyclaceae bacterium]
MRIKQAAADLNWLPGLRTTLHIGGAVWSMWLGWCMAKRAIAFALWLVLYNV